MINGHGGNIYQLATELGCRPSDIADMSSNVNPFGPPPGLTDHLRERLQVITALPEAAAESAVRAFAARFGIQSARVVPGNGTTQLIHTLPLALKSRRVMIAAPTYADYADACRMHEVSFGHVVADASRRFAPDMGALSDAARRADTMFICNPNNPTGSLIPGDEIVDLCRRHPAVRFVIDESYLPFATGGEAHSLIRSDLPNVMVLHSMSKIFRVPGLRIGFLAAPPDVAESMKRYYLPWSVNSLAHLAVTYLMARRDEIDPFIEKSRQLLDRERREMTDRLGRHRNIEVFPSCTSFLLARLSEGRTAEAVCSALARERILIRNCGNFEGLSERFIRISLKTPEINRLLVEKLIPLL
ncbi:MULTISPECIES: threonine-phosphate decarboxylase CobD [Desulfococcus]|jgi:threonine-phosphate decarboxylase|uniref:threonine-phosphate decarboxylase n=1 Tax=Desulfococcus multivorans DSM 2059 TaxID=1121405 RepID=S7TZ12_DESML|nr:threonine-phosphate decarboxylase CobD [Desulfococcus multivorans]AOY57351.1 CobD1: threonine-phosphate decarboxylase [Desulfococcus multivorans]EPR41980.1 L-threonine-O-3-phosphate decarboxylase [Desulfococcus multivorans DSM 2059]MDX9819908.1 threonine-phosphate decarboxylase CobD [Desulfococcus multivorans]SKA10708.1 L-threonine O-3-phosphate decarboxylase [Desulfococcus multivorans DSM 2059]